MITGIGTDITDIRRMEQAIQRHGIRFLERVFTKEEIAYAHSKKDARTTACAFAKRWAAKEAMVKALGTGFGRGLYWRDVEIVLDENHCPRITIHHTSTVEKLKKSRMHVSMSDEYPYALAYVIIESPA